MKRVSLDRIASGSLAIHTESPIVAARIWFVLRFRHKFHRVGNTINALDEKIFPNYVRGDMTILAGWDHWLGYHFIANAKSDEPMLSSLYDRVAKGV